MGMHPDFLGDDDLEPEPHIPDEIEEGLLTVFEYNLRIEARRIARSPLPPSTDLARRFAGKVDVYLSGRAQERARERETRDVEPQP